MINTMPAINSQEQFDKMLLGLIESLTYELEQRQIFGWEFSLQRLAFLHALVAHRDGILVTAHLDDTIRFRGGEVLVDILRTMRDGFLHEILSKENDLRLQAQEEKQSQRLIQ